jgi:hypothetical protein
MDRMQELPADMPWALICMPDGQSEVLFDFSKPPYRPALLRTRPGDAVGGYWRAGKYGRQQEIPFTDLVLSMPGVKALRVPAEFLAQLLPDGHRKFGPDWCWRPGRTRCLVYGIDDVVGARVPPEPCGEGGFLHCPGNYHALVGAPDDHTSPAHVHVGDLVQGDPGEPDGVTHDDLGRSQPQP